MAEPSVMVPEKRMTRDDKRALEKVIIGDFALLDSEVRDAINKEYEAEKAEVARKYANDRQTTQAARKVRDLLERHRRAMEDLLTKLASEGVTPTSSNNFGSPKVQYTAPQVFESAGRTQAFAAVEKKYNEIRNAATRSIMRDRSASLRTLALAGITNEVATELLNGVVSKETVVARAAAEARKTQPQQITA